VKTLDEVKRGKRAKVNGRFDPFAYLKHKLIFLFRRNTGNLSRNIKKLFFQIQLSGSLLK